MRQMIKYIAMGVVRLVLALTYLFSGVVKLIDPRGTQYKIEDYGAAFGMSNLLPEGVPLTLACVLAIVEFLMGIYLLFGIRRRLAATVSICFLLIMTPLTMETVKQSIASAIARKMMSSRLIMVLICRILTFWLQR